MLGRMKSDHLENEIAHAVSKSPFVMVADEMQAITSWQGGRTVDGQNVAAGEKSNV